MTTAQDREACSSRFIGAADFFGVDTIFFKRPYVLICWLTQAVFGSDV
jgi:hypothetical protein